jgi:hypothetical protein
VWRAASNALLGERGPSSILLTISLVVNCAFVSRCTFNAKKSKTTNVLITVHAIDDVPEGGLRTTQTPRNLVDVGLGPQFHVFLPLVDRAVR